MLSIMITVVMVSLPRNFHKFDNSFFFLFLLLAVFDCIILEHNECSYKQVLCCYVWSILFFNYLEVVPSYLFYSNENNFMYTFLSYMMWNIITVYSSGKINNHMFISFPAIPYHRQAIINVDLPK